MINVEVYVDKAVGGFKRRLKIVWGDGAKTEIMEQRVTLYGVDGNIYNVPLESEHGIICREILKEHNYTVM